LEGGAAIRLESGVVVSAAAVGRFVEDGEVDEADRRLPDKTLLRPRRKPRHPLRRIASVVAPLFIDPPPHEVIVECHR
jgi:hypothetical protein